LALSDHVKTATESLASLEVLNSIQLLGMVLLIEYRNKIVN